MLTLYLTGPREGRNAAHKDDFRAAARKLREAGFTVLCLSDLPDMTDPDPDWHAWARQGIRMLLEAEGVAKLRGTSHASTVETDLARELDMPVQSVPGWLTHARHDAYMERLLNK